MQSLFERSQTLGLIGMGRIGQAVAVRARAFGMKVVAFDPLVDDRISSNQIHAWPRRARRGIRHRQPARAAHRGHARHGQPRVPGEDAAGLLPDQHARGGLVVESDLRDSLVSGHLAGAGLDVLNHEPPEPGNPLLGLPNVVLSPHIAGTDLQSMSDMAELAAPTIVDLYHNRWPAECVVNWRCDGGWRW